MQLLLFTFCVYAIVTCMTVCVHTLLSAVIAIAMSQPSAAQFAWLGGWGPLLHEKGVSWPKSDSLLVVVHFVFKMSPVFLFLRPNWKKCRKFCLRSDGTWRQHWQRQNATAQQCCQRFSQQQCCKRQPNLGSSSFRAVERLDSNVTGRWSPSDLQKLSILELSGARFFYGSCFWNPLGIPGAVQESGTPEEPMAPQL